MDFNRLKLWLNVRGHNKSFLKWELRFPYRKKKQDSLLSMES